MTDSMKSSPEESRSCSDEFFEDKVYDSLPKGWSFYNLFATPGKQGLVGLLKHGKKKYVYKISQYINYLSRHETEIMKSLDEIRGFCPHFCQSLGCFTMKISPEFRKAANPFEVKEGASIETDVMVMEHLENSRKLYRFLKNKKVDLDISLSCVRQTLCGLLAAQKFANLAHYDLHSNNVMVQECDPNCINLYRVEKDRVFIVPTRGYTPTIIDFGFSYSKALENKPITGPLGFTDVGFMSNCFDQWSDLKLFLISVSNELKFYRGDKVSKDIRKWVRNSFKPLDVDWGCGWDKSVDMPASNYVISILEDKITNPFFEKCIHFCVDIVQCLQELPLKKCSYNNIFTVFDILQEEFEKIGKLFKNNFYQLYIFKRLVDFARDNKVLYEAKETRLDAIRNFRHSCYGLFEGLNLKWTQPKLHYEKLLCSLILFSRYVCGIIYEVVEETMENKNKLYSKIPHKTPMDMIEDFFVNFPDDHYLDNNCYFQVYDYVKKTSYGLDLDAQEIEIYNALSDEERRVFISQILDCMDEETEPKEDNTSEDEDGLVESVHDSSDEESEEDE